MADKTILDSVAGDTGAVAPFVSGTYEERLRELEYRLRDLCCDLEAERDPRCVFTYAYATWLQCLGEQLREPELDDPGWTLSIAEGFVKRYRGAVEAYDTSHATDPWKTVFDALDLGRCTVMESLVFSLVAHLVHDLPLVLDESAFEGTAQRPHIADYEKVNQAMSDATDIVIDCVAKRYYAGLPWLQRIPPRIEALLVLESARVFRGMAWYTALRIRDQGSKQAALRRIVEVPCEIVRNVTEPHGRIVRWARTPLRVLESRVRSWPSTYPDRTERGDRVARVIDLP